MSTFTQWRTAAARGEIRRVTWVCGDQPVLVEEVIDTIRAALKPSLLDSVSFTAGHDPDATIWAAAHQYPMDPVARRLILVRHAERLRRWAPLAGWMGAARALPHNHLVFVAAETDLPHSVHEGTRVPAAHLNLMRPPRGHLVRCGMPAEADALSWVATRAPLDPETARYLLTRAGGNLGVVAGVTAKLALFPTITAGPGLIDQLCREIPSANFTDSLIALRKADAILAASTVEPADFPRVLGLLDARLDLLDILHRALRTGVRPGQIRDVAPFLVHQLWPLAKHYDPLRTVKTRQVLAVVDTALRSGARDGVLQSLVALW